MSQPNVLSSLNKDTQVIIQGITGSAAATVTMHRLLIQLFCLSVALADDNQNEKIIFWSSKGE